MTWLPVDNNDGNDRDAVLGLFPEVYAKHKAFLETCERTGNPELLNVCKARMAQLIKSREHLAEYDDPFLRKLDRWYEDPSLTDLQRNALTFVEQFILDPAIVTPESAGALEKEFGTDGVVDFTTVIASFEATIRFSALFDLEPAS